MVRTLFIAATRQHVGKTSVSMGLMRGFADRLGVDRLGFCKPVGQQHLVVDGIRVDKDVQVVKEFFGLKCAYRHMSPVLVPKGYTRDFIDGKHTEAKQRDDILESFEALKATSDVIVVEGTGHTGVGSIVEMNNARVAKMMDAEMVLIANGGLGSAFDELELNRCMCEMYGVPIRGVIVNKVRPDRLDMITEYFEKLMRRWDVPLLGVVPDESFLGKPSLLDFERVFDVPLLSGSEHRQRHYHPKDIHLAAHGLNRFLEVVSVAPPRPVYVSHGSRSDIVLGFLNHAERHEDFGGALILTGTPGGEGSPNQYTMDAIGALARRGQRSAPVLYIPRRTWEVITTLNDFVPKLNIQDTSRCDVASAHYAKYLNFDEILGVDAPYTAQQ